MSEICNKKGNLLEADADALVNTVNTVGVMGKGIALQFKKAFPENFTAYRAACDRDEVRPGHMFVFETGLLGGPRWIINFPTKRHWRAKTRVEDIESGLEDLVRVIGDRHIRSIAIPPLGCGNGGLQWGLVKPIIEDALRAVPDLDVRLYEPDGPPAPRRQIAKGRPLKMTLERAAFLRTLAAYRLDPSSSVTRLVAQKLAYLLEVAGVPLRLRFVKGEYGPYAESMNTVLQDMEGSFIRGYGDRTGPSEIEPAASALEEAEKILNVDPATRERVDRVIRLIDGFESPYGLELLATVHWAASVGGASGPEQALHYVGNWTTRKRDTFGGRQVEAAWARLADYGWLPASDPLSIQATDNSAKST